MLRWCTMPCNFLSVSAVMCCIHLAHTETFPSPASRPNLLVHKGGSWMCNKSCYPMRTAKNFYRLEKNCNVINTENLCLRKYNFSYFFHGCQESIMPMICLLCAFSGYNLQLKFLMQHSSDFLVSLPKQNLGRRTKNWKITQCTERYESDIWDFFPLPFSGGMRMEITLHSIYATEKRLFKADYVMAE